MPVDDQAAVGSGDAGGPSDGISLVLRRLDTVDAGFEHMRRGLGDLAGQMNGLRGDMTELRGDMTELRSDMTELRSDMTEFRSEIRGEIRELRGEIKAIWSEMRELRRELDAKIDATRNWAVGVLLLAVLGLITKLMIPAA